MKVVSFSLELGGGVDLVCHDPGDVLLNVLHPLRHLLVPHVVHILDEGVVLLPERHPDTPRSNHTAACQGGEQC